MSVVPIGRIGDEISGYSNGSVLGLGAPRGFDSPVSVSADGTSAVYVGSVDPVRWSELPYCFEIGSGGSTLRHAAILVGSTDYVWYRHTTVDGVLAGPDPGDTEAELAGRSGTAVTLPVGLSSAEEHAELLATALRTIPSVTDVTVAGSANADSGWSLTVTTNGAALATGTRQWADRGAAGLHGSHIYRMPRGGEVAGSQSFEITRIIGSRIEAPPTDATIWAVQIALGTQVDAGAERPRIQYWASTSAADAGIGTEMLYDFGQIPASQMVVGDVATIYLTAEQSVALRAAIDGAVGTFHWLSVHATSGTRYNAIPTGAGFSGETADENLRVNSAAGAFSAGTAATTWTAGGSSFPYVVPLRLVYDIDPCTTGEHHTYWGGFAAYDEYPGPPFIGLPDTLTTQTADITGLEAARILRVGGGQASGGDVRRGFLTGGDTTLDAPQLAGATLLVDCGTTPATGTISYVNAPTGVDTARVPSVAEGMWIAYKGQGAAGPGEGGPGPFTAGRIDQPTSWVRRFGVNIGQNPMERDNEGPPGYGDDATPFVTPIVSSGESSPENLPSSRAELWHPAISFAED